MLSAVARVGVVPMRRPQLAVKLKGHLPFLFQHLRPILLHVLSLEEVQVVAEPKLCLRSPKRALPQNLEKETGGST